MIPQVSLRTALSEPSLLGGVLVSPQPSRLRRLLGAHPVDTWAAWKPLLLSLMGERLEPAELETYRKFTARQSSPTAPVREAAIIAGRRSGKDRIASVLAAYLGGLCTWPSLVKGETGVILCMGAHKEQATVTFRYIEGAFDSSPMLSRRVISRTSDTLVLDTGVEIQVRASNFRRVRGLTCCAVIVSEVAFWMPEDGGSSNPDVEILRALRPSLATTQGPLLLISSPYARSGALFDLYDKHWGRDDSPVLVINGATRDLNPTIPESEFNRAFEEDAEAAAAEWNGKFRSDIAQFISRDALLRCVANGVSEIGPQYSEHFAFIDPSGGSSDSMTMCIAHYDDDSGHVVIDQLREFVPPFSPDDVVRHCASELRRYNVHEVTGDRYAGEWVRESFARHDITYTPSELSASELYGELLPLINTQRIRLLDHQRAITQLLGLERRTSRVGRDSISHRRGAHDDLANAIAGAAWLAGGARIKRGTVAVGFYGYGCGPVEWQSPLRNARGILGMIARGEHFRRIPPPGG